MRTLDAATGEAMVEEINRLRKANESLGGTFEVRAFGLVPGLGTHIGWDGRLDARLAEAIVSIQAIKGASIGEAWDVAGRPGSDAHDEIFWDEERGWFRESNHAGGVEGGMSNGEPLIVHAAMKPLSTLTKPLRSVDTETKHPAEALRERTDATRCPLRRSSARRWSRWCSRAATGRSSAAITSTTSARRLPPTRSGSGGGGSDRVRRLHGRGQERCCACRRLGARNRLARRRRRDRGSSSASRSARTSSARAKLRSASSRSGSRSSSRQATA